MKIKITITTDTGSELEGEIILSPKNTINNTSKNVSKNSTKNNSKPEVEQTHFSLVVPEPLMSKIDSLDEKKKFPILWSFCSNQIMTVDEFLTECTKKGFTLSHAWLPSAGGNFSNHLVTNQKIFHKVGKRNNKKTWAFTDMGKLKTQQIINNLKNSS